MSTLFALSGFEEIESIAGSPDRPLPQVISEPTHRMILSRTGKKHPNVLYVPTAREDQEAFMRAFARYYRSLGCGEINFLCLIKDRPSVKEIRQKIAAADVIYVNGGNTYKMLATWKRYGVDQLLCEAYGQGTVMAGHSAGAVCWFSYGCSDSFYKRQPSKLTAMGVVPAVLCPHFDTEPVRQEALKHIMKRTPRLVALALGEHAALEIDNGVYRVLGTAPGAKARRLFWLHGAYVTQDIEPSEQPGDINILLTRPEHIPSEASGMLSATRAA
jgi:dipeptidase E